MNPGPHAYWGSTLTLNYTPGFEIVLKETDMPLICIIFVSVKQFK